MKIAAPEREPLSEWFETWPSLSVKVQFAPWHWRIRPRMWGDWDLTPSCTFYWLMFEVSFIANRPLFTKRELR